MASPLNSDDSDYEVNDPNELRRKSTCSFLSSASFSSHQSDIFDPKFDFLFKFLSNIRDPMGKTLLHYVDDLDMAEYLVKTVKMNINIKDMYGKTPITYVKNEKTRKFLIDSGADIPDLKYENNYRKVLDELTIKLTASSMN